MKTLPIISLLIAGCCASQTTDSLILTLDSSNEASVDTVQAQAITDSVPLTRHPKGSYELTCRRILSKRDSFFRLYNGAAEKEPILGMAGKYLDSVLIDKVLPFWYGTPWDFEGHTNEPGNGTIACGYLISTTLKHLGLNINRYRLAQQSAYNEIRTLTLGEEPEYFFSSFEQLMEANLPAGVYVVGLDSHVGYLLSRDEMLFFIHSNPFGDSGGVEAEWASASEMLAYSNSYCLSGLSNNKAFLRKWLSKENVPICYD